MSNSLRGGGMDIFWNYTLGLIDYVRVLFMEAISVWSSMDEVNAE